MRFYFLIIFCFTLAGGAAGQNNPLPIIYSEGTFFYPYNGKGVEVDVFPGQVYDIELQPGERIQNLYAGQSSKWLTSYSWREPGIQQAHVILRPGAAGIKAPLHIKTNQRSYRFLLKSRPDDTVEKTKPKTLSFYFPGGGEDLPSPQLPYEHNAGRGEIESGDFGFPWQPETTVYTEGSFYITLAEKISPQDLPDLYSVAEDGTRQPLEYYYWPESKTIVSKTFDGDNKALFVYTFSYPGFLGFSTVSSEKTLYIFNKSNQKES